MPLNLDSARRKLEDLMQDEVIVHRMPRDAERVFNDTTGQYDDPDPVVLYEGRCMFTSMKQEPRAVEQGGTVIDDTVFVLRLPVDDTLPRIRRDDRATITLSENAPSMVGQEFIILDESAGTFSVSRTFHMSMRERVID